MQATLSSRGAGAGCLGKQVAKDHMLKDTSDPGNEEGLEDPQCLPDPHGIPSLRAVLLCSPPHHPAVCSCANAPLSY